MSTLIDDLRTFKHDDSAMTVEEMANYIVLRQKLDESYIADEAIEGKPTKRRGRKQASGDDKAQKQKTTNLQELSSTPETKKAKPQTTETKSVPVS